MRRADFDSDTLRRAVEQISQEFIDVDEEFADFALGFVDVLDEDQKGFREAYRDFIDALEDIERAIANNDTEALATAKQEMRDALTELREFTSSYTDALSDYGRFITITIDGRAYRFFKVAFDTPALLDFQSKLDAQIKKIIERRGPDAKKLVQYRNSLLFIVKVMLDAQAAGDTETFDRGRVLGKAIYKQFLAELKK